MDQRATLTDDAPDPWAPVFRSPDGVPEVDPGWVDQTGSKPHYRIVDVRQPHEFNSALGHIRGAELIPLNTLPQAVAAWPRDQAVVVVCRSGTRSAAAALEMEQWGFVKVASMRGGMLAWNSELLPIEVPA